MPIDQKELGRRLKVAREAAKMTQEAVAEKIGIGRPALSLMESAERAVSSLELDKLCFIYGRDIADFLGDSFADRNTLATFWRINEDILERPETEKILNEALVMAREQTRLEQMLDIERPQPIAVYKLADPKRKQEAVEQGAIIAEQERQRLGLGFGPIENLPDLMESQGIRTHQTALADNISGFTMNDDECGPIVVINNHHAPVRRRYSYAHECAHVLMDRLKLGIVTRESERASLFEMRANSFAANFLMPERGVRQYLARLGKDQVSRTRAAVFDENGVVPVEYRTTGDQHIKLYDIVELANFFGVSRAAAAYRLLNLRLLTQTELQDLLEQDKQNGQSLARMLKLNSEPRDIANPDHTHRFLSLALEALRRNEVTLAKFRELVALISIPGHEVEQLLKTAQISDVCAEAR